MRIANRARKQLQLGACGGLLLAAGSVFRERGQREHWSVVREQIRRHVYRHHLTSEGAFATFAGTNGVDVTSALFPVWSFCAPDCAQMEASIRVLEREYQRDGLLRRDDRTPQHQLEGAFLPATFWLAQYWAVRNDSERARCYIDAGLRHANDVGVLPEEVDWQGGRALGNLPLGMIHASLINAIIDLAECEERVSRSRTGNTRQVSSWNSGTTRAFAEGENGAPEHSCQH